MASKHILKLIVVSVLFISMQLSYGQIGINTVNPDTSAALDVQGTNKGVLFPRTTQLQLTNIFEPATGLTLFQTNTYPGLYYNLGTSTIPNWLSVGMYHNGNDLFWDKGNVGVGLSSPLVEFHIRGNGTMFRLEAGVGENAFMEFYADGASSRSGYLGYITNGGPHLSITNSRTNGDIVFTTAGTGRLTTNRSMTIGDDLTVTDQLQVNNDITVTDNITSARLTTTNATVTNTMTINNDLTVTDVLTVNDDVIVTDHVTAARVTTTGNVNAAGKIQEGSNNLLPAGVIVMWSGTTAPAGWALCNGSGGTPDLRNRFVVGSGSTYASGATGGATTHQHSVNPANTSTTSSGNHSHTVNPGSFNASIIASGGTASINPTAGFSRVSVNVPSTTSSDHNGHAHTVDIGSTPTTSGSSLPPYYALAYIIKL